MQCCSLILFTLVLLFCDVKPSNVDGTWKGNKHEFLKKFAVINGNHIYMYGNFTGNSSTPTATLVFAPANIWKSLYKNIKKQNSYDSVVCTSVMDPLCNKQNDVNVIESSYIRKVPCEDVCDPQPENVTLVPHSQLTYKIENVPTQFYYAILVPCLPAAEMCNWTYPSKFHTISYDVWFVSGDPFASDHDIFTYQFSYDEHGVLVILTIMIILYGILVPFHLVGYTWLFGNCDMPNFVRVFTVAMLIECTGLIFVIVHYIIFAHDGQGIVVFYDLGFFLEVLADCVFLLIVLLIAKGYRITISIIRRKRVLTIIWLMYFFSVITFSVWTLFGGLPKESDKNEYQEWAGGLLLACRLIALIYTLFELRSTYLQEDNRVKIRLYVIFFIMCLIWFLYFPVSVIIAAAVNPVYRAMIVRTSNRVFDFMGFCGMAVLLYPYWSNRYFQFSHWFTEDEAARLI